MLLIQRTPDKHDPGEAYARWEFPGGKLDGDETAWDAALREWSEETGATLDCEASASWTSDDGVYQGFVVRVPSETSLALAPQAEECSNIAWWDPDDLDDPVVRDKVVEALGLVQPLLKSFHRRTDEIIDKYQPMIQEAMREVLSPDMIRHAINVAYGSTTENAQDTSIRRETGVLLAQKGVFDVARQVLQAAQRQTAKLRQVLAALYREAAEQGAQEAAEASGGAPASSLDILAAEEQWVNEVVTTQINRLATMITDAYNKGVPMNETIGKITSIVGDAQRAWLIAETEYARAMTLAARATYKANHVPMVKWLAQADACSRCRANEAVSPLPLGDAWPSGDVPVHPRCRCAEAPALAAPRVPLLP